MRADEERVVITGMGASTHWGIGTRCIFERADLELFPGSQTRQVVSESANGWLRFPEIDIDLSTLERITRNEFPLASQLLAAVAHDFGDQIAAMPGERATQGCVALGDTSGNFQSYFDYYRIGTRDGYEYVNPVNFPTTLFNYATVTLSSAYGLKGSSTTVSSGFSAGLDAIGYAATCVRLGKNPFAIAGGLEELNDLNVEFLETRGEISRRAASRPLHPDRDGAVPGEGVGVLLLEPLSQARELQRPIYGEILGYGTAKGFGERAAMRIEPAIESVQQALENAFMSIEQIEAVFPSANGCLEGDAFEAKVLSELFGECLRSVPVYPIKAIIGECFTAAGPLASITAVHALAMCEKKSSFGSSTQSLRGINGIWLPERLAHCANALVYSFGLDDTYAALVIGSVPGR